MRRMSLPLRRQWLIAAVLALAAGGVAVYFTRPPAQGVPAVSPGSADPISTGEIRTILEPDAILALDHPRFVAAANTAAPDGTQVIGVAIGSEAHAFPIAFLSHVEIVNDHLGGGNIAVTW